MNQSQTESVQRGYCLSKNGAAINFKSYGNPDWRTRAYDEIVEQARQWKLSHPETKILVEEHAWDPRGGGDGRGTWVRTYKDREIHLVEGRQYMGLWA